MIDRSQLKLGRPIVRHSAAHRLAAHKVMALLPAPPAAADNTDGVTDWGMMLNGPDPNNPPSAPDGLGDCTIAGLAHSLQVATLAEGKIVTALDSIVEGAYKKYCGYDPNDPNTDQGGIEMDILAGIKRDGFAGDTLLGYVSPDPQNLDHVRKAIAYFKSVYMGAELPLSAQSSGLWDVVSGQQGTPGGWGGHCMVAPKYTADGKIQFVTWGENQPATLAWWQKYVDECHVLLWASMLKLWPAAKQEAVLSILQEIG